MFFFLAFSFPFHQIAKDIVNNTFGEKDQKEREAMAAGRLSKAKLAKQWDLDRLHQLSTMANAEVDGWAQ